MTEKQPLDMRNAPGWLQLLGYLASIALTVAGIVFGFPYLFKISPNFISGFAYLMMLVPLFPAVQSILMGEQPATLGVFWKTYFTNFIDLFFEIFFIVLIIPFIAIELVGVLVGLLIVSFTIVELLFAFQRLTGVHIGVGMSDKDALLFLGILLGLAVYEGLYFLLRRKALKHEDSFYDFFIGRWEKVKSLFV